MRYGEKLGKREPRRLAVSCCNRTLFSGDVLHGTITTARDYMDMTMRVLIFPILLLTAFALSACSSPPQIDPSLASASDPSAPVAKLADEYHIGVDDQVTVNVWGNPDLTVNMPVRPDGKISMPLIGDVQAGGLTPEEVAEIIRVELSEYIRDPNVTVLLTALRSHEYISRIRVTGAVNQPLSIPYRQGITVLDAVLAAGGVNPFASADRAQLHRTENGETTVYDIPLGRILTQGDINANIHLQPGDVITVPERLF